MPSRGTTWTAAAVAALLAAGVAVAVTHDTGRPPGSAPAATRTLHDETDHLTFDVPAGWQTPTLTPGSYADMVRSSSSTATVGLFAIDPRSHTTLVVQSAAAGPGTLSGAGGGLPKPLTDQYKQLGIRVVSNETVQLPLGPARHVALALVVDGKNRVASQYFLLEGAKVIAITIEGPGGAGNLAVHDRIAHRAHRAQVASG